MKAFTYERARTPAEAAAAAARHPGSRFIAGGTNLGGHLGNGRNRRWAVHQAAQECQIAPFFPSVCFN